MKTFLCFFFALLTTALSVTVRQLTNAEFEATYPVSKRGWEVYMNFPGNTEPSLDYLGLGVYKLAPGGSLVDQDKINLIPSYYDGTEADFETANTLTISPNGTFTWIVDDVSSTRSVTLSGSLAGKVLPGQNIVFHSIVDEQPFGISGVWNLKVKEGTGTEQPFTLEAYASSDGDQNQFTTLEIAGWSGTVPLKLSFHAGNILIDNLSQYRSCVVSVYGIVPEPPSTLLLGGGFLLLVSRRRFFESFD